MKLPQKYDGLSGERTTRCVPRSSTTLPEEVSRARSVRKPRELTCMVRSLGEGQVGGEVGALPAGDDLAAVDRLVPARTTGGDREPRVGVGLDHGRRRAAGVADAGHHL